MLCPPGSQIRSEQWLHLQFWSKTPRSKVSLQYTGRLNVKFMVLKRQFRSHHDDEQYTAALYRYMKEYAIMVKEHCTMVSIDDKHRIKVGEPGYPVVVVERGRRVMVKAGATFEVGDHDYTKCSIIPPVALVVDIPEKIKELWFIEKCMLDIKLLHLSLLPL